MVAEMPAGDMRGQANEGIAGLGDGRVGQQALDVALGQRQGVAERHGEDGNDRDQRAPIALHVGEHGQQHAHQHGETSRLGGDRNQGGDGRGRALVDVGRPEVERHHRDFEAEADQHQQQATSTGSAGTLPASSAALSSYRLVLPVKP